MSLKRKRLSLQEKIDIIVESEKVSISGRKLAEKFGVGRTQVNEILRNKSDLKKCFEEGFNTKQKRKFPKTAGLPIEQAVYDWFCKARNEDVPISGPLIKKIALQAAENLKMTSFKASNGWLEKFCQRHNIRFKTICRESADIDMDSVGAWTENPNLGVQVIITELIGNNKSCDSNSESDAEETKSSTSNIKAMGEVCEKLRDIQNFLFSNDKCELAVEVVKVLAKCESDILQTKLKTNLD